MHLSIYTPCLAQSNWYKLWRSQQQCRPVAVMCRQTRRMCINHCVTPQNSGSVVVAEVHCHSAVGAQLLNTSADTFTVLCSNVVVVTQLPVYRMPMFIVIRQQVHKCSTPQLDFHCAVQQCGVVVRGCKWLGACHGQTAAAG